MNQDSTYPAPFDTATFIFPAEWQALSGIFAGTGVGVLFLREGRIAYVNRGLCEQLGFEEEELLGCPVDSLLTQENGLAANDAARHDNPWDDPAEGVRIQLKGKDGEPRDFELVINRIDALGDATCTIWVLQPAGTRLLDSATAADAGSAQAIIEQVPELLLVLHEDTVPSYVSPSTAQLLGHRPETVSGRRFAGFVHKDDQPALKAAVARAASGNDVQDMVLRLRHACGRWRSFDVQLRRLTSASGGSDAGYILTGHDMTEELDRLQRLQTEGRHRLHYLNRLLRLARQPQMHPQAALKVILKASARAIGAHRCVYWEDGDIASPPRCLMAYDDVKRRFSSETSAEPRWADTLAALLQKAAREEHVLAFNDVDRDPRAALYCEYFHAHSIKAALLAPLQHGGKTPGMLLIACIGEARAWRREETDFAGQAAGLLTTAFAQAAYARRQPSREAEPSSGPGHGKLSSQLAAELRRAITEGELQYHYQPQVDLQNGELCSVAALLRWRHPRHGMLLPDDFLPLAEAAGLGGLGRRLGIWAFAQACSQLRDWEARGIGRFRITLKLSSDQVSDAGLAAALESALERYGIGADRLELDIPEMAAMRALRKEANRPYASPPLLERAAELGVGLCIDEFGTGCFSMAGLRCDPVHKVKIDRSLVTGLPGDADSRAIAEAIIAMAQPLGLTVVAEGVETLQQMEYLRDHGCDRAQGNFFSPPLTAEQFETWLIRH